jgi:hypothetical protein
MRAVHYRRLPDDTTPTCKVDHRFEFTMTENLDDVTCRACLKTVVLYWKEAPVELLQKLL